MKSKCLQCGKEVERRKYKKKFCTKECESSYWVEINSSSNKFIHAKTLRAYLIRHRGDRCSICGINTWNDMPITLQIDHVDGNHNNRQLSNLRLLCPNCHTQTETWGNKKRTSLSTNGEVTTLSM